MLPLQADELKSFFAYVTALLEYLQIPYMVVGGFAAIFYGEPRFTADVDIVVDMQPKHIDEFVAAFPSPNFYVSKEAIQDSLPRRYPFNVIQTSTGAKIDLVPLTSDTFTRVAFTRRHRMPYAESGETAEFISPEDIILAKMLAYRDTSSEKHLRDALGVLIMQWNHLNFDILKRGASRSDQQLLLEQLMRLAQQEADE
jgi:hypothetical protein